MGKLLPYYLPVYLVLYMAVAFVIPTYRTWKATGINPITFGNADTAHNYVGFVMKLLIALLFIAVLLNATGHEKYLAPLTYLQNKTAQLTGLVLIHLSLVWISIAQYQMSTSWRIGIDEVNKTELRTTGLFALSRNPVFLGILVSVYGLFAIQPNALTLLCAVCTYFTIQIQVRLEEEFLRRQHGNAYQLYCKQTRRYI